MIKKLGLSLAIWCSLLSSTIAQTFSPLVENINASFRGIATYGKEVVWVSGSNGTVGYTINSGKDWNWVNPQGYDKYDFRDIAVFSKKEAIIISAGSPAVVLRTNNAGKTWTKVYEDVRANIFLDACDFRGKEGYILGDPIDGQFQLLKSKDKGKSWIDISNDFILFADQDEAAFAASGTILKVMKDKLYIGTGGKYASFFNYNPKSLRVDKMDVPIWSGSSSTGIFSLDFINDQQGIVVGGNYQQDQDNRNNILLTYDAGQSWLYPDTPVAGYRSAVLYIDKNTVMATGTSGTDISFDAGRNWKNISKMSFNSIAKSSDSQHIYLTGSKGNVYLVKL